MASKSSQPDTRPIVADVSRDLFDDNDTIQRAAYDGNLALMEMLRRKGASITSRDLDGRTALHWASAGGHIHLLRHILKVDPNGVATTINSSDDAGWTPLHSAVSSGHTEAVAFLLENGSEPSAMTKQKRTILHYLKGSKEMAELVIPKMETSVLDGQDELGNTAMHRAAALGQTDLVKILLEQGARATIQNHAGDTALHSACEANEADVCLLFLRHESSSDIFCIRNKKGKTPSDVCATSSLRSQLFMHSDRRGGKNSVA